MSRFDVWSPVPPGAVPLGVDPKVTARALECAPAPCMALHEAAWVHVSIGEFAPEDTAASFWSVLGQYGCDASLLGRIRSVGGMTAVMARGAFEVPAMLTKL